MHSGMLISATSIIIRLLCPAFMCVCIIRGQCHARSWNGFYFLLDSYTVMTSAESEGNVSITNKFCDNILITKHCHLNSLSQRYCSLVSSISCSTCTIPVVGIVYYEPHAPISVVVN